jgi:hypothetical protein
LLVRHLTEVTDLLLQIRIADLDFGQACIVHRG